jgi:Leucine-rich repeat (LRR) protein
VDACDTLGGSTQLINIALLHTTALTGTLPESIANMTALYDMDLSSNQLEGKLPNLEKLSNLRLFLLDQNKFTGTISPTIRNLQHLG